MYRLFSFLLEREVSLVGFGLIMAPIQFGALYRDAGPAVDDTRRLAVFALYCLLWALICRALRGRRLASAGVGAYMALQGLLYVLMLLGNLMSMVTGSLEQAANFAVSVALGPWFLIAGAGLMGQAWRSYRTGEPLPDAAVVEYQDVD